MVRARLNRTFSRMALAAGVAAALTLLWTLWMTVAFRAWPAPYWFEHRFTQRVDSPQLALEFARNPRDVDAVMQRGNDGNPDAQKSEKAARALAWQAALDCVRAPLVCAYLVLLGLSYSARGRARAMLMAGVGVLAAVAWCEDALLLMNVTPVFWWAVLKWLLTALVLILLAGLLASRRRGPYSVTTRRLVALLHVAAAVLVMAGLAFQQLPWLSLGADLFGVSMVINAAGLLGPAFAIEGEGLETNPNFCQERRLSADSIASDD